MEMLQRILIAEDDATSRRVLELVLGKWGFDVASAVDGNEALEKALAPDSPDLMIFDWMMPGLEGPEVIRQVRAAKFKSLKYIIMLTTMDRKEDIVTGLKGGADDYITKPFSHGELRARIDVGIRILELSDALSLRIQELEVALEQVKALQGILPICMHCHKIRDEDEVWQRLEKYVEQHSEAHFSHGLCPECAQKYYGDLLNDKDDDLAES